MIANPWLIKWNLYHVELLSLALSVKPPRFRLHHQNVIFAVSVVPEYARSPAVDRHAAEGSTCTAPPPSGRVACWP